MPNDFHTNTKTQEDPHIRFTKVVVIGAMRKTVAGSSSDAFWLMSKDAEEFLDAAEIERAAMIRWVIKALLGEAKLPNKI